MLHRKSRLLERFRRESLAWINLELHQNVTQARFLQMIDQRPFLFLELVSGGDLSKLIDTPQLVGNLPKILLELRKYAEALKCYDHVLEIDPMHAKAWYNEGNLLFDPGRHRESIACYERSLQISPLNASAWYNKGLLLKQGDLKQAAKCFEETLKIEPHHVKARLNLDI